MSETSTNGGGPTDGNGIVHPDTNEASRGHQRGSIPTDNRSVSCVEDAFDNTLNDAHPPVDADTPPDTHGQSSRRESEEDRSGRETSETEHERSELLPEPQDDTSGNETPVNDPSLVEVKIGLALARTAGKEPMEDSQSQVTHALDPLHSSVAVDANTLVDAKQVLAAARQDQAPLTPSKAPHMSVTSATSSSHVHRSGAVSVTPTHVSEGIQPGVELPDVGPTLATAQLVSVEDATEDARSRVIRETRERILAETVRAEPYTADPNQSESTRPDPRQKQRQLVQWAVALCVFLCIVIGVVVGSLVATAPSSQTPVAAPTTLETATPTAAPLVYLEDGRLAFTSTQQLYDAVDAYYAELDENDIVSPSADVSVRHGHPIGTWDVSRLSNFSRVFDPARDLPIDPQKRPSVQINFDEDLSGWNVSRATTMMGMFATATKFTGRGLDQWDVRKVTDFSLMFAVAQKFNSSLAGWLTSSATKMNAFFTKAETFNHDVSHFDVSRVTTMSSMFADALAFRGGDLTQWNVSNVVNMNAMFSRAPNFGGNVSSWDVSKVNDMNYMFQIAETFSGDVSLWDVGNVINFDGMFKGAINFVGGNLTGWNTSRATNMDYMFSRASKFNGDISTWDVSRVTTFENMFEGFVETAFNGDLSLWDVGNAESTQRMFWNANAFNSDLSRWDVSKLTDASFMFLEADGFNQSLCEWRDRLPATANVADMFKDTACVDESNPLMGADGASWVGPLCAVCP